MSKQSPRIPLLPRSHWTDEARDVFAVLEGPEGWENGPKYDIVLMFAQHPKLMRPFLTYNRYLMFNSTLDHRSRELVTLRVAWTCKSEYEWLSHVRDGLRYGLADADIEAVKVGPDSPHWSTEERALISLVDEMRATYTISDATWETLSSRFDHKGMMDLIFTIGNYIMLSSILNGLRVQPEAGAEGADLAAKYGTP